MEPIKSRLMEVTVLKDGETTIYTGYLFNNGLTLVVVPVKGDSFSEDRFLLYSYNPLGKKIKYKEVIRVDLCIGYEDWNRDSLKKLLDKLVLRNPYDYDLYLKVKQIFW